MASHPPRSTARVVRCGALLALLAPAGCGDDARPGVPPTVSPAAPAAPAAPRAPSPAVDRAQGAPRASLDRKRHDFGVVRQQQVLVTEFALTNGGTRTLRVTGVHGNCGCLVGAAKATSIEPGASTPIVVTFSTHAMVGPHTKWVQVATDDPERPVTMLEVSVDISAGVVVDPSHFYFPLSLVGSNPSPSVVLRWKEGVGTPFRVTGVEVRDLPAGVAAEVATEPYASPPWQGWRLTLRFREPPGVGSIAGAVTIRTDAAERPEIEALVGGVISGRVWLSQHAASVGAVPEGKGATLTVLVRGFDASVKLGAVTATAQRGQVTAKAARSTTSPGAWEVEIRLPPGASAGAVEDRVRVTTEVPGEETHWIAVGGMVTPKPDAR